MSLILVLEFHIVQKGLGVEIHDSLQVCEILSRKFTIHYLQATSLS